jgi:hypothetical protein
MGWSELHDLAIKNEASEIKDSVLLRGNIVKERAELSGMTPIHKACMYGRLSAFQELQELGKLVHLLDFLSLSSLTRLQEPT